MRDVGRLVHLLRSTQWPEQWIKEGVRPECRFSCHKRALERDDFILRRTARTGGHVYTHPDGRMTLIHYHRGSDTLDRKTLPDERKSLELPAPAQASPSGWSIYPGRPHNCPKYLCSQSRLARCQPKPADPF